MRSQPPGCDRDVAVHGSAQQSGLAANKSQGRKTRRDRKSEREREKKWQLNINELLTPRGMFSHDAWIRFHFRALKVLELQQEANE